MLLAALGMTSEDFVRGRLEAIARPPATWVTLDADGNVTGFYRADVHRPDQLPAGARRISEAWYQILVRGQEVGKRYRITSGGLERA